MTIKPSTLATDDTPEAPQPSPPLVLYMRVVENDAPADFDGGRLVMKPVRAGADPAIIDASFVVSAATDAFLVRYPWKSRAAKHGRFYRVVIEEVPESELPTDTSADAEVAQLEARLAELRRLPAGAR